MEKEEPKDKKKLFGDAASRVSTEEMNLVFSEINRIFREIQSPKFPNFELSKSLPEKNDHGDIDIILENIENEDNYKFILNTLGDKIIKFVKNGNILHCLYRSAAISKDVHVDFITASKDNFSSTLMYHAYGDFSGILGVVARKLKYNYASNGFYKIYTDKKNANHYIKISDSLCDGLVILGYGHVSHSKYHDIKSNLNIIEFISDSALFSSEFFKDTDLNHGDRKRMRAGRKSARFIRDGLINLNKIRIQEDDDYYFKKEFPELYSNYLQKVKEIEEYVPYKAKYGGSWIMEKFKLSPGPIIGKIQKSWSDQYGESVDSVEENELYIFTENFIRSISNH